MIKTNDQLVDEALCNRGYEKITIQKNGGCGRQRFRKKFDDMLSIDITVDSGNELYGVEYAQSVPNKSGKHIKISNLHTVTAEVLIKKIEDYEQLVRNLTGNSNGG